MKTKALPLVAASILMLPTAVNAEKHHHQHHAGPTAPIGVMASHMHPKGEWMLSYSFMQMTMDGNRNDTDSVPSPLPLPYMVTPESMDMEMHMFGVMMGYSENITLMAMLPVTSISMDHTVNMSGMPFTTEVSGIGDLKLAALIKINQSWLAKMGVNLPTGSIDEKDITPAMPNPVQLPYPMQLGSGSFDLNAGITYNDGGNNNSWGTQANIIVRLNDNDRDYHLGNRLEISSWFSYGIDDKQSTSLRIKLEDWANISGVDADLNPMMVPTADANLRAGTRVDVLLGYNYQISQNYLIGVEAGAPIYQKLDGPQLETDLSVQLGVQYAF